MPVLQVALKFCLTLLVIAAVALCLSLGYGVFVLCWRLVTGVLGV